MSYSVQKSPNIRGKNTVLANHTNEQSVMGAKVAVPVGDCCCNQQPIEQSMMGAKAAVPVGDCC